MLFKNITSALRTQARSVTVDKTAGIFTKHIPQPQSLHEKGRKPLAYNVNSVITFFMQSPRGAVTGKFCSHLAC